MKRYPTQRELIDGQILSSYMGIIAFIIAIIAQFGFKEKETGIYPNKNYDYLNTLVKINVVIVAFVALYFLYVSYVEYEKNKTLGLELFIIANILAVVTIAIKMYVIFSEKQENAENVDFSQA